MRADLVAGILPVREDGRMLLLQRPTGTWEPPAGRLGLGEGFEEGAVRELYEETGMLVAPQEILATWVGEAPSGRALAAVTFIGRTDDDEVRISDEHLDHRWVTLEEWLGLPSWWAPESIRRVAGPVGALGGASPRPAPPDGGTGDAVANAVLGAGVVIADPEGPEPRALLMRRRKHPAGLWENPGGILEPGEDFEACARREAGEETGLEIGAHLPGLRPWWTRVEPWKAPDDPRLYAGVGFLARYDGGEVRLEESAHDDYLWATEGEWRGLRTWYTPEDSDRLWAGIRELRG